MATIRKKSKPASDAASSDGDTEAEKTSAMRPDEMPADVIEFITAMDAYKREHQRPFPNWSEVLEVLKALGYSRPRAPGRP